MTAKIPAILLCGFTLLFATATGRGQTVVIMQDWVAISSALAGHADIGLPRVPATGVTVELCSSDWRTVLASTKTDQNGYFSLKQPPAGKLFYIRLSAPGVNPYQLRVRIKKHGVKGLDIHLNVAT
jgi:hypothetical protein